MYKKSPENDNILLTAENEIKQICNPVINELDLAYYSYGQFYDDGKCILLSTNKNVFLNHFEKEYQLTIAPQNTNPVQKKIYNLILIDNELPEIIADEHNLFGHGVMLDIIKKHRGYYEMFCYVAKQDALDPANKFLNSLDKLDRFSEYFLEKTHALIRNDNNSIIELPTSMKPSINGSFKEEKEIYSIYYREQAITLSKRQIECLSFLTMGKTTKEIALILEISIKTVEDHIKVLKLKLNCNKKSELCYAGIQNNLTDLAFSIMRQYRKKIDFPQKNY